jgi:hypothetical protein
VDAGVGLEAVFAVSVWVVSSPKRAPPKDRVRVNIKIR